MPENTRPAYELYGVPREQIEKDYDGWVASGWIGTAEEEGEAIRIALADFGFANEPKSGWAKIGYEVRIIELSMSGRVTPDEKGHAELAKECSAISDTLRDTGNRAANLSHHKAISVAQYFTGVTSVADVGALFKMASELDRIADYLRVNTQKPKWRTTEMRSARVELACKLAPVFEMEFGLPPRPVGGSAVMDLDQTNLWTIFYQAIASLILNEKVTPDRQDVLWEAARPSEI